MIGFAALGAALVAASAVVLLPRARLSFRWALVVVALLSAGIGIASIVLSDDGMTFLRIYNAVPDWGQLGLAIGATGIVVLLLWSLFARGESPRRARLWIVVTSGLGLATAIGFCVWEIHDLAWSFIEPWRDVDPG